MKTVSELIKALASLDQDLPVFGYEQMCDQFYDVTFFVQETNEHNAHKFNDCKLARLPEKFLVIR